MQIKSRDSEYKTRKEEEEMPLLRPDGEKGIGMNCCSQAQDRTSARRDSYFYK